MKNEINKFHISITCLILTYFPPVRPLQSNWIRLGKRLWQKIEGFAIYIAFYLSSGKRKIVFQIMTLITSS